MSQESVEMVHRAYESLARRDWDALWRDTHPDFELRTQMQGTYVGREEAQKFVVDQIDSFESWQAEPEQFIEHGDQVVVLVISHAQPRGTAAQIEIKIAHIWTIRDGMILTLETFPKREEALEAAGLSE